MSYFTLSDGSNAAATATSEYEIASPSALIPDGSTVLAMVDEAKWEAHESGAYFVALRWTILQPESVKNRKVFQNLWIEDADPKVLDPKKVTQKKDKAIRMLLAVDVNAGGGIAKLGKKPNEEDLMVNLANKPMVIRLGVWSMMGKQGDEMSGNYVQAVAGPTKALVITNAPPPKAKATSAPAAGPRFASSFDADEIPF